ncbi:hypothetical protein V9T40_006028 [Parthenolecanium corni]|uniref:Uncharacterized protein n=1 Tax=Parthenolecanium corni TaxID=536013 RepID=A0AAN9TW19_9HEMI
MKVFLLIFIFAWVEWNVVYGIQSTILADLKRMEQSPGSHIPSKDIPSVPVPDVQNNLDKDEIEEPIVMESAENPSYQQLASLRSKFFYDRPDIYDVGLYEDRQKRNINKRSSLKRSDRIFRTFAEDNNRIKRESQFNQLSPEDVLSLLAMLESESRRKPQFDSRRYGHEYDPYSNDVLSESENEDVENAGERSVQIPEFAGKSNLSESQKLPTKLLFKMKIGDLHLLEYNSDADSFKFKNHNLSLVMCGGTISAIYRDDSCFSFELDDGSGTIPCFHKFGYDRDAEIKKVTELLTSASARYSKTSVCPNQTHTSDVSVVNATNDNSVIEDLEREKSEACAEILSWFQEEIVGKTETRKVGDLIHLRGHLTIKDGIRKINVDDFRMVTNPLESVDLAIEIDYLKRCVY